mmetsp:Transcript_3462/g.7184  ORF Transcript_3462/g.7184 Transcript_3462/m.7184 type:complete len:156 (+) Transcript_3462:3042-3509(+)|eukprot:CAMPEP_0204904304 /NCGR_PEP_ID=MMETSP1397-20131031/4792_1 /ASSEMBLY_ACC=CAM_ASM_000891 /TAXON_ID=49980 /ORGANISM="Climacostomum Climacostomum virens, Strain Stock W-24" /LENGTH=155 /DNA_ID=CAMNT_0052073085 /DNA_START=332 /DNA_END=799 /DNA_ORIENTATION=-
MRRTRPQAHKNTTAYKPEKYTKLPPAANADTLDHLCPRCQAKLMWRKQFRKYKPRTVPGRCNICTEKKVGKAYRKVCDACSKSRCICAKCMKPYVKPPEEGEEEEMPGLIAVEESAVVRSPAAVRRQKNEEVPSPDSEEGEEESKSDDDSDSEDD